MNEQDNFERAGDLIVELSKPDLRFIELTREEALTGLGYLILRQFSPVVGLRLLPNQVAVVDSRNPLGRILRELTVSVREAQSGKFIIGFRDEDIENLSKDVEAQEGIGNPNILEKAHVFLQAVKSKWDGAEV